MMRYKDDFYRHFCGKLEWFELDVGHIIEQGIAAKIRL